MPKTWGTTMAILLALNEERLEPSTGGAVRAVRARFCPWAVGSHVQSHNRGNARV